MRAREWGTGGGVAGAGGVVGVSALSSIAGRQGGSGAPPRQLPSPSASARGLEAGTRVVPLPPGPAGGLGSFSHLTPDPRRSLQMLNLTGNGRLTADVELRSTRAGDSVATVSLVSDRREREADPVYVDLLLWRGQAWAAADHLVKGQAVSFSGRFEPHPYTTRDGRKGVAYELHDVALEYGAKPRGDDPAPETPASAAEADDIPF